MKPYFIFYIVFWLWVGGSLTTQAQIVIDPGDGGGGCTLTINGLTTVTVGQTSTYTFTGGTFTSSSNANWSIVNDPTAYPFAPSFTKTWSATGIYQISVTAFMKWQGSFCGLLTVQVVPNPCPTVAPTLSLPSTAFAGCTIPLSVQNPDATVTYRWYNANNILVHEQPTLNYTGATSTTYYVCAWKSGCAETSRTAITVNPTPIPFPVPNGTARATFAGQSLTLSVASPVSGLTYQWYAVGNSTPLNNISATSITVNPANNTSYYIRATACSPTIGNNSSNIAVSVVALPTLSSTITPTGATVNVARGETTTLSVPNIYHSYIWYKNGVALPANTHSLTTAERGTYYCRVGIWDNNTQIYANTATVTLQRGTDGQDLNYIISRTILKEGVTQESQIDNLLPAEIQEQTVYFDGLGRDIQAVVTQGSPTGKDIVQFKVYDAFGREQKAYLPYTGGNTGRYQADALIKQPAFYNVGGIANTEDTWKAGNQFDLPQTLYPYSETVFENSPLNRPTQKGAVGKAWQVTSADPTQNKAIKTKERALNDTDGVVMEWKIGYEQNAVPQKVNPYTYSTTTGSPVWVTELTDEHNNKTIEYKNGQGQVILKKVQTGTNTYTETYYVYDDFGNLRYVIPPLATEYLKANGYVFNTSPSHHLTTLLCFRYVYDARKRMIAKQVPSGGEARVVYDLLDRPILTQDAKQGADSQPEWTMTKYDKLGRPVLTGLLRTNASHTELQNQASNHVGDLYEKRNTELTYQYYTANTSYPNLATVGNDFRLLSATYYDDYAWKSSAPVYEATLGNELNPNITPLANIQGQVTATVVRKLEQNIWSTSNPAPVFITTVSFYDDRYRVIQTQTGNYVGTTEGIDILCTQYDFAGKVMKTLQRHIGNNKPAVDIRSRTEYNHVGQPLKVYHQIGNDPTKETTIAEMRYNELGTLVEKKVGKDAQGNPLQIVNFRHNIRGWLTHINDANLSEAKDLFGMEFTYEQVRIFNGVNSDVMHNGNITSALWKSASDRQQRGYLYSYDALNRLTQARYYKIGQTETNESKREDYSVLNMQYDVNGNIIHMERKGVVKIEAPSLSNLNGYVYGQIDNLTYRYNGNRLVSVNDQATLSTGASADFRDNGSLYNYNTADTQEQHEYQYDLNGSLEKDKNKKISSIIYNHLGLATFVQFEPPSVGAQGDYIVFTYDAAGVKLSKMIVPSTGSSTTTDYVGGFIYEGGQLQHFGTGEGRVLAPSTSGNADYVYEYHYKDHLGNLRLAYREGKEATPWKATMDAVNAQTEEREFANLALTRDVSKKRGATGESCRVNTAENKPIGAWKSIPVTQGDKVKAKVFSHYVANTNNSNATSLFLALGNNALAYGTQTLPTGETKLPPSPFTNLTAGLQTLLMPTNPNSSTQLPKAYLAIIQYNENNQIVGQAQISYVTTASLAGWIEHNAEFTATANGRIEVFVANESNTNVWFDDLEVSHTGTMIVQETHYDPWGMELVGIGKKGDNRFKFMGKETESNFDLNWIETDWRGYDAQLGRFHQVDKLADKFLSINPYQYSFNNPIRLSDPSGLMPQWLQGIWDNSNNGDKWVNNGNGAFNKAVNVAVFTDAVTKEGHDDHKEYQKALELEANSKGSFKVLTVADTKDLTKKLKKINRPVSTLYLCGHGPRTGSKFTIGSDKFDSNLGTDFVEGVTQRKLLKGLGNTLTELNGARLSCDVVIQHCFAGGGEIYDEKGNEDFRHIFASREQIERVSKYVGHTIYANTWLSSGGCWDVSSGGSLTCDYEKGWSYVNNNILPFKDDCPSPRYGELGKWVKAHNGQSTWIYRPYVKPDGSLGNKY